MTSLRSDSPEAKSPPHDGRARCFNDAKLAGYPEESFLSVPFNGQLKIQEPVTGQRCRLTTFEDGLHNARTDPAQPEQFRHLLAATTFAFRNLCDRQFR